MKVKPFKKLLACVFFGIMFIFFCVTYSDLVNTLSVKSIRDCECINTTFTTETITPLEDKRTFIISPYYDQRQSNKKMVRSLSITHHQDVKALYCWFCCETKSFVHISKAEIDMHSDRFDFPYVTTDLLCTEPPNCNAKFLSVHSSSSGDISQLPHFQILNKDTEHITANFTVCISTMFGNFSNVLQFIQTMEMYQILGAQRVMIYLNSCSPLMEKVMQYYIKRGTLEVIPWPIERYLRPANAWHYSLDPKDIGYYGQLPTLNDCIYRNMYRSRFVLLNDIDEIILPFNHQTWDSMMKDLESQNPNAGIFLIENHIFPQTFSVNKNFTGTSSWKDVPGSNILKYVFREPDRADYYNARKMIIDPRKVIQTSVHSTLKSLGKEIRVPLQMALVYHCRGPLQKNLPRASLIEDKTIWKFNGSLIRNVNKVLREIPFVLTKKG